MEKATPEPVSSAPTAPSSETDSLAWGNAVQWRDWESAVATAEAENKPICLVVYASWCPRCKELAPVFQRHDIAHATANAIMVHQDQDAADAGWLQERYGAYGRYIPRILFLDPRGEVHEDLQSGHPRYPYFYAPMVADRLLQNLLMVGRR